MATFKSNYESMKIVSESGTVMFNSIFFDSTMFFRHFSNNFINQTKTLSEIPEIKTAERQQTTPVENKKANPKTMKNLSKPRDSRRNREILQVRILA